jgi:adenine phosphoribosyltransferase
MKNTTEILQEYKTRERAEHISTDDILNKVTQETIELLQAIEQWGEWEIRAEAWDVLVNLVSMADELWFDMNEILLTQQWQEINVLELAWKWNESVQAMRWRYSRSECNPGETESLTKSFIAVVLNYTEPQKHMWVLIETNLHKIMMREWLYKPDINVKDYIAEYADFPKEGINFKDISPILANPDAMRYVCHEMAEKCGGADKIVALDARGFLFAPMIGQILWIDVIMARKPGKLPGEVVSISYDLEYGSNTIEIQKYNKQWELNIELWEKVAVVDDLLATWGTAMATIKLIEQLGWVVSHAAFVIGLEDEFLLWKDERKELQKYQHSTVVSYDD